jgi:hypothetical protein
MSPKHFTATLTGAILIALTTPTIVSGQQPSLRFTTETGANPLACAGPGDTLYVASNDPIDGAFVVRLSPTGDVLWRRSPLPGQETVVTVLTTDDEGNLYVAGATLPPGTPRSPNDGLGSPTGLANTGFVIRVHLDGTMSQPVLFSRPPDNYASITALAIEPGTNGRLLAAGQFGNTRIGLSAKSFLAWVDRGTLQSEILAADIGGQNVICAGGSACIGISRRTFISEMLLDTRNGLILVQGSSNTTDFATPGAIQETCYCANGRSNGWVGVFDLASGARLYTTYLSGRPTSSGSVNYSFGPEAITSIQRTDQNPDQVVIAGITGSQGFPTTPGAYQSDFKCPAYSTCRVESAFLATIDWRNSRVVSSTLYGERPAGGSANGLIADPAGRGYWLVGSDFLALFDHGGTRLISETALPAKLVQGFEAPVAVPGGFAVSGAYRISRYDFTTSTPASGRIDAITELSSGAQPGPAALGVVPSLTYNLHGSFPEQARAFLWGVEAAVRTVAGTNARIQVTLPSAVPGAGNMVDLTIAESSTGRIHSTVSVNLYPAVLQIANCQDSEGVTVGGEGNTATVVSGATITCRLHGVMPGQTLLYSWLSEVRPVQTQRPAEQDGQQVVTIATPQVYADRVEASLYFRAGGRTTETRRFLISQR